MIRGMPHGWQRCNFTLKIKEDWRFRTNQESIFCFVRDKSNLVSFNRNPVTGSPAFGRTFVLQTIRT